MNSLPVALAAVAFLALTPAALAAPNTTVSKLAPSVQADTSAASSSVEEPLAASSSASEPVPVSSEEPASSSELTLPSLPPILPSDYFSSSSEASSEPPPIEPVASGLITAQDPQSVLDELVKLGYAAQLNKLDNGRPSIALKLAGLNTYVDFYDCADDMTDCYTLLFGVDLDLPKGASASKVNQWNSEQITGRVSTNKNGDPTLDFTLSTFEGVSPEVFDQNVDLWEHIVGDFKSFFNFR